MHGGCPVTGGRKHVLTRWLHVLDNEGMLAAAAGSDRIVQDWQRTRRRLEHLVEPPVIGCGAPSE